MTYFSKNYSFDFPLVDYVVNMSLLALWNVSILIFLSHLIKKIFTSKNFMKLFAVLMLLNVTILFLFLYSVPPVFNYSSWQSISQSVSFLVALIIYNLSILCLIYSDKKGLSCLVVGLVIAMSGDFLLSYSFLEQGRSLATYGDLFWFLGIFCVFCGMPHLKDQKNSNNWLRSTTSIKGKMAFWAFGISIINILPCFILAYFFSLINKTIFLILPSLFMITSVIVVILSRATAKHFEKPFKKITDNIESLMLENDKSKLNSHFVIEEFIFLQEFILKVFDLKEEREAAKKALISLSAQVAHDIRSPLTALNTCLNSFSQIPEKQRILMRNATNRIHDIANNLLHQYEENKCDIAATPFYLQSWLFAPVLESIVSEKRLQFEGHTIELEESITSEGFSAFAVFDLSRMKRLLSNLINNASEALSSKGGTIIIRLETQDEKIILRIIDNGCGIATDLLDKITLGTSFKEKDLV